MDIAGEMKVDILHWHYLGIASAGSSSLAGPKGGFPRQTITFLLSFPVLGEADCVQVFPPRQGKNGCDIYQFIFGLSLSSSNIPSLGLVFPYLPDISHLSRPVCYFVIGLNLVDCAI